MSIYFVLKWIVDEISNVMAIHSRIMTFKGPQLNWRLTSYQNRNPFQIWTNPPIYEGKTTFCLLKIGEIEAKGVTELQIIPPIVLDKKEVFLYATLDLVSKQI